MPEPFDSISSIVSRGGPVMYPLLALSLVAITLATERALFWVSISRAFPRRVIDASAQALRDANPVALAAVSPPEEALPGRILAAINTAQPHDALAVETAERFRPRIERFSTTLSTIITAAPLLGILGTVLGIIESFDLIGSAEGVSSVSDVATGIAQALITTAFGLTVALITIFPYMVCRSLANRMLGAIELLVAAHAAGASKEPRTAITESPAARALEMSLATPADP